MYFTTIFSTAVISLAALSAAAPAAEPQGDVTIQITGQLGNAPVIKNNPKHAKYAAGFGFHANDPYNIQGTILTKSGRKGKGVDFDIYISNLPKNEGPFGYHIHDQPVPLDGRWNCSATLAHLDPFIRGEVPGCEANKPQTCQVGDLSGKHGKIANGTSAFHTRYTELYASLKPGIGAFFGNRSIVVHNVNKTRIACANFQRVSDHVFDELKSQAAAMM